MTVLPLLESGFSYLAFSATAAFMQHLVMYFWNRFEVRLLSVFHDIHIYVVDTCMYRMSTISHLNQPLMSARILYNMQLLSWMLFQSGCCICCNISWMAFIQVLYKFSLMKCNLDEELLVQNNPKWLTTTSKILIVATILGVSVLFMWRDY